MGSFRATLEVEGKEFDVLFSEYTFNRDTDRKGKPSSNVSAGLITAQIESTEDNTILEAMLNSQFKSINGKITYKRADDESNLKELTFENAYVVFFKETLRVEGEIPMVTTVSFSAEKISMEDAVLENRWPLA